MNILVKATPAKKAKTKESQTIAYAYAVVLVILVVAQLFSFDKFLPLLENFMLPGGIPIAHLFGGLIVASEVLALPFLLGFKLSPLMRVTSMALGWLAPLLWFVLTTWLMISTNSASNVGFFGSVINLSPGWWAVFVSIALGILAAWSSWGLWPFDAHPAVPSKK
ncbi:MAG TPA: hypothetical protein VMR16_00225 [Candidatus Saccharimonadales bacterium]|jgi:hypothetical protein|nr:hypothetical protein [Candidatus Saccharimonadales bacterium]